MDVKNIEKINKLAKTLKDSGLAASMDDAVKMAEEMTAKGEEAIQEKIEKESAEETIEEKEPFIIKRPEEKTEDIQEEIIDIKKTRQKKLGQGDEND